MRYKDITITRLERIQNKMRTLLTAAHRNEGIDELAQEIFEDIEDIKGNLEIETQD
jgi:hypothetical protein